MTANQKSSFPANIAEILHKVGITKITGRPLHSYRLTERSHDELEAFLMQSFDGHRLPHGLGGPFVLWASEYFRRYFDGGQPTWSFLFDPLNATVEQATARELTAEGLKAFRRPAPTLSDAGLTLYLKSLAAEGGLPEHLMADEGSYRPLVLGLMHDVERHVAGCPPELLIQLAAWRASRLPAGFRNEEFYTLFGEFAVRLVELRNAIPKDLPSSATQAFLDVNRPGWRDDLPLRLENASAQSLLSDALSSERRMQPDQPLLERRLVQNEYGDWHSRMVVASKATIPSYLVEGLDSSFHRARLRPELCLSEISPALTISLERDGDKDNAWSASRVSGPQTASFAYPIDEMAIFQIHADGQVRGRFIPANTSAIDLDEGPGVWVPVDLSDGADAKSLRHVGSSSISSRSEAIWILVKSGQSVSCDDGLTATIVGPVAGGELWLVTGKGALRGPGWMLRLETGSAVDVVDQISAYGQTGQGLRDRRGTPVYQGMPKILIRSTDRFGRQAPEKELRCRRIGEQIWRNVAQASDLLGPTQIGWIKDGNILSQETIHILPQEARIKTANRGPNVVVTASGLPIGTWIALESGATNKVSSSAPIEMVLPADLTRLSTLTLKLHAPGSPREFQWQLARPSLTGALVDPDDRVLSRDIDLSLDALRGWRLVLPEARAGHLQLRLVDTEASKAHDKVVLSVTSETALTTFLPMMRGLLALGGPDSSLRLRLLVGSDQSNRMTLRRFMGEAAWVGDCLELHSPEWFQTLIKRPVATGGDATTIEPEAEEADTDATLSQFAIRCVNLSSPGLWFDYDGVTTQTELSPLLTQDPGPWLILPQTDIGAIRPARPKVSLGAGEGSEPKFGTAFLAAGQYPGRKDRISAYAKAFAEFTTPYGIGDVNLFENLIDCVGDVCDLAVLDQVTALAKAPEAEILLLLRSSPDRLGDRLSLEDYSPFSWATTPVFAWSVGIRAELGRLTNLLTASGVPQDQAPGFSQESVALRLMEILQQRPELGGHIVLAAMETGLFPAKAKSFGRLPSGINNPERALQELAGQAVARHEGETQLFEDVLAQRTAPAILGLNERMRGLLDAPLIAAEFAHGLRKGQPKGRLALSLLHFRHHDPVYFEAALPAAVAYLAPQPES